MERRGKCKRQLICQVNWPTLIRPKDLGGLGVPDLDKFDRAKTPYHSKEWIFLTMM